MKPLCLSILFIVAVYGIGCRHQTDMKPVENGARQLSGCWSSVMIAYPDDPIFKDTPPNKKPGAALLGLNQDGRFVYNSNDDNATGVYQVQGKTLVFTRHEDGETFQCGFELRDDQLTLFMDDGFRFDFERIQDEADDCIPNILSR